MNFGSAFVENDSRPGRFARHQWRAVACQHKNRLTPLTAPDFSFAGDGGGLTFPPRSLGHVEHQWAWDYCRAEQTRFVLTSACLLFALPGSGIEEASPEWFSLLMFNVVTFNRLSV